MFTEYINLIMAIGCICSPFILGVRITDDIVASRIDMRRDPWEYEECAH